MSLSGEKWDDATRNRKLMKSFNAETTKNKALANAVAAEKWNSSNLTHEALKTKFKLLDDPFLTKKKSETVNLTTTESRPQPGPSGFKQKGKGTGSCFECGKPNHRRGDCKFNNANPKGQYYEKDPPAWVINYQNSTEGKKRNAEGYLTVTQKREKKLVKPAEKRKRIEDETTDSA